MDISMCEGNFCPLKLNCYRYTAKPDEIGQTYFSNPPYKMSMILDDNDLSLGVVTTACAYFWNNKTYENDTNKSGLGEGKS